MTPKPSGRVVCHFSCGAASAVATKLAIEKYGSVEVFYIDTGSEHPDNVRFLGDCVKWFGRPVGVLKSQRYNNIWEVFEKHRFLSSPQGAPCTGQMKRKPWEEGEWRVGDVEVFGYTSDESHRLARFRETNSERIIECPLIDAGLTKADCLQRLADAGIELPVMYRLGFRNNNCIGCVKARDSVDYWKRVRKHFPAHFERMARLERDLSTTINRRTRDGVRSPIYLDEIEPGDPKGPDPKLSCGILCMLETDTDLL